jgi:hypothetical protein
LLKTDHGNVRQTTIDCGLRISLFNELKMAAKFREPKMRSMSFDLKMHVFTDAHPAVDVVVLLPIVGRRTLSHWRLVS